MIIWLRKDILNNSGYFYMKNNPFSDAFESFHVFYRQLVLSRLYKNQSFLLNVFLHNLIWLKKIKS